MPPNSPSDSRLPASFKAGPGFALAERRATAGPVRPSYPWRYALGLALALGLLAFVPHAHAATEIGYGISSDGTLGDGMLSLVNSLDGTCAVDLYRGTYPDTSILLGNASGPCEGYTSGSLFMGPPSNNIEWIYTNFLGTPPAPVSEYWFNIQSDTSEYYWIFEKLGTDDWNSPYVPAPDPDGNPSTHIIRITEPAAYSIVSSTSTPFSVSFDAQINASTTQPNAYQISYRNDTTYAYVQQRGYLVDDAEYFDEGLLTVSTTTLLTTEGTWSMEVVLGRGATNGTEGGPGQVTEFSTIGPYFSGHRFSVVVETNVSHEVPGASYTIFPAESCDLNLNPFEESTFNFGDCMGYLFQPPQSTWEKYGTLTLAASFPFSYAYQFGPIKDALYANENTSSQAITVDILGGTLTLLSRDMVASVPFAPTIREILSAVMWFLLAYALYRMILRVHDTHTV